MPKKRGPGRPLSTASRRATLPAARCTTAELRRARELARLYAGGSLSEWIRLASIAAPGKKLTRSVRAPEKSGTRRT